jgi:hypothetical protein
MYLNELLDSTEYTPKWINIRKTEVHASRYVHGVRHVIGCVFSGTEAQCNLYVASKNVSGRLTQ